MSGIAAVAAIAHKKQRRNRLMHPQIIRKKSGSNRKIPKQLFGKSDENRTG